MSKTGVLLLNLGTPHKPTWLGVSAYLREFLSDPRVIELPYILRAILVNCIIVPTRASKSAHAYATVWQDAGSPLLVNTLALQEAVQEMLGDMYVVAAAMRYGKPSIQQALQKFAEVDGIVVIPLFPQYASATTGSALQKTLELIAKQKTILPLKVMSDFFDDQNYIAAKAAVIKPYLDTNYDHVLFSYHGLPVRQLVNPGIDCYQTRCLKSAQMIANHLQLPTEMWSVSFQSRLGRLEWIKPYTDDKLIELRNSGVQRVLVACPSFVSDCLETLEEIGMRAKESWLELGGEQLELVPCLNTHPAWISALTTMIKRNSLS